MSINNTEKEGIEQILKKPISELVRNCDEQTLLTIWSLAINRGIQIGLQRAIEAENNKLRGLSYGRYKHEGN